MTPTEPDTSIVFLSVLTVMGLVFLVAPPAGERGADEAIQPFLLATTSNLEPSGRDDKRLPTVEVRRVWSGFELVPAEDRQTPLHFEILEGGRFGWGPTWMGQLPVEPRGDLIKVRLHEGRSSKDLAPLREILAEVGMMAPDATLGADGP